MASRLAGLAVVVLGLIGLAADFLGGGLALGFLVVFFLLALDRVLAEEGLDLVDWEADSLRTACLARAPDCDAPVAERRPVLAADFLAGDAFAAVFRDAGVDLETDFVAFLVRDACLRAVTLLAALRPPVRVPDLAAGFLAADFAAAPDLVAGRV